VVANAKTAVTSEFWLSANPLRGCCGLPLETGAYTWSWLVGLRQVGDTVSPQRCSHLFVVLMTPATHTAHEACASPTTTRATQAQHCSKASPTTGQSVAPGCATEGHQYPPIHSCAFQVLAQDRTQPQCFDFFPPHSRRPTRLGLNAVWQRLQPAAQGIMTCSRSPALCF